MEQKKIYAIGIMSGTSLDGLDLAYCSYIKKNKNWSFSLLKTQTIPYGEEWRLRLSRAHQLSGEELMSLHCEYGRWIGEMCKGFIKRNKIVRIDLICSHGHTIFHQPKNLFTFQLGDGNAIHAQVGVPVIYDFRSFDVQLGGEGAPLVPIGDRYLFSEYDVCLNLGGIANFSMEVNKRRVAFDVCFANMGLNYLMRSIGEDFDKGGYRASKGKVNPHLLHEINLVYKKFQKERPSLAREQFESDFTILLSDDRIGINDRLATFCESIADQLLFAFPSNKKLKILATGGGAKNEFLISRIKLKLGNRVDLTVPNSQVIDFKEAIVFGLLGVLRNSNKINVLRSVTTARRDSSCGVMVGK